MFTGIIETTGQIRELSTIGTNRIFWIDSPVSNELRIDQSVSHNGVCLTVDSLKDGWHRVTAIKETLDKTTLKDWKEGDQVNLERCLAMNGRLDGHLVQGHVDSVALCLDRKDLKGSWEFEFEIPAKFSHLMIEKGSICLNGISLTLFNVRRKKFKVAIIPFTLQHTNMSKVLPGTRVNIEFDMVGKYINRLVSLSKKTS